jgi:hypothetical protein
MITLHSFARVEIDRAYPWIEDLLRDFSDLSACSNATTEGAPLALNLAYSPNLSTLGQRHLYENFYIGPGVLTDRERGVQIRSQVNGAIEVVADRPAMEWILWLIQLALLPRGASLAHAAAVEKDGRGVLLASWGGVGKTAIVSRLIKRWGWKLLGDDFVILSKTGYCYGFPKPMVLYPYHRELFPEVFSGGKGPWAPTVANSFLSKLALLIKPALRRTPRLLRLARAYNPQSVRILPSDVFGKESLSSRARITKAVWLERVVGRQSIEQVDVGRTLPSRIIGSTMNEFDGRCVRGTNAATGIGLLSSETVYRQWQDTVSTGLARVTHSCIQIPAAMHIADVPDAVNAILDAIPTKPEEVVHA